MNNYQKTAKGAAFLTQNRIMKVFINKHNPEKQIASADIFVIEGNDAFFLKDKNISLPKSSWELRKVKRPLIQTKYGKQ